MGGGCSINSGDEEYTESSRHKHHTQNNNNPSNKNHTNEMIQKVFLEDCYKDLEEWEGTIKPLIINNRR